MASCATRAPTSTAWNSELIVRSGHSVQSNPKTVLELRRILLLHAEEACREKGIGCAEPPTLVSEAR